MRNRVLLIIGTLSLLSALAALAQPSGGNYSITKSTIDNGGGRSAGGSYTVTGTAGQADASLQAFSGASYRVTGGFWGGVLDIIFKDSFESE